MRCALAFVLALAAASQVEADPPKWITLKGQVVLPADEKLPMLAPLIVNNNKQHCLAKGPLPDEKMLVNPKTRGIKNVVVWLRPADADPKVQFDPKDIHPADAKRKPQEVVIDQPCCLFVPRVLAARVGDTIIVKNSAPVGYNFFWSSSDNGNLNVNIPAGGKHTFQNPLVAESAPIQYKCTIHPWMLGYVRIFDHPYFAVTDADGNFEIKNVPTGNWRLVYWHENVGFKDGRKGRAGDPVAIPAANNTLEMKPTDFNVK